MGAPGSKVRGIKITDAGHEILDRLQNGCNCSSPCPMPPPGAGTCVYFIAKTRGPIGFGPCECVDGGKTYHDRDGVCLRCNGGTKK